MQLDEQDVHDMLDTVMRLHFHMYFPFFFLDFLSQSQDVTLSALSDVRLVERRTSDT